MNNKEIRKDDKNIIFPIFAILFMLAITIVLSGTIYSGINTMSPEIYFYVNEPVITDVTVEIEDGVTKTFPEVPVSEKIIWKNVRIENDGNIIFNGEKYPYLYYEGCFKYPQSNYGWIIQKIGDQMFLNNKQITKFDLKLFLREQFERSGLYDNEISDIMQRIEENNMLRFSSNYLIIRYIPIKDVNKVIELKTSFEFSIIRRHFLIQESNEPIDLVIPLYETIENNGFLIHETAINKI